MESLACLLSRYIINNLEGGIDERIEQVKKLNMPYLSKDTIKA